MQEAICMKRYVVARARVTTSNLSTHNNVAPKHNETTRISGCVGEHTRAWLQSRIETTRISGCVGEHTKAICGRARARDHIKSEHTQQCGSQTQ